MRNSYLEYYQLVLQKVSFDRRLFHKEYHKAIRTLSQGERNLLDHWVQSKGFGDLLPPSDRAFGELTPPNIQSHRAQGMNSASA